MKKKSVVVLSMVLGFSLITGCGAKEEATTAAEVTTEVVTEAEEEEVVEKQLRLMLQAQMQSGSTVSTHTQAMT